VKRRRLRKSPPEKSSLPPKEEMATAVRAPSGVAEEAGATERKRRRTSGESAQAAPHLAQLGVRTAAAWAAACGEAEVGRAAAKTEPEAEVPRKAAGARSWKVKREPGGEMVGGGSAIPKPLRGAPCFACTGVELGPTQKRLFKRWGASFVSDWSPAVTHLIADTFRRTTKMMCAICTGAIVVTPEYLAACRESGKLVDEAPFLLRDAVCEEAFARKRGIEEGYSLAAALKRARRQGPLLSGISVYCFPSIAEKRELPHIVAAAGGTWLTRFPTTPDDNSMLLLAERTVSSEREQQRRRAHEVYDVELLREAACTQRFRRGAYKLR